MEPKIPGDVYVGLPLVAGEPSVFVITGDNLAPREGDSYVAEVVTDSGQLIRCGPASYAYVVDGERRLDYVVVRWPGVDEERWVPGTGELNVTVTVRKGDEGVVIRRKVRVMKIGLADLPEEG